MRTDEIEVTDGDRTTVYHAARDPRFKSDWRHGLRAQAWCMVQWGSARADMLTGWDRVTDDMFIFDTEDKLIAFVMRWG